MFILKKAGSQLKDLFEPENKDRVCKQGSIDDIRT